MRAESHEFQPDEVMAYLDGEVTGERALALADHLEHCPDCSSLANDFCAVSQQLALWKVEASPLVQTPSDLHAEVPAALEAEMVCAEFPEGVPRSYETAAFSLTGGALFRRPWVWALAGVGALVVTLSVQSFRMSKDALDRSATAQLRSAEEILKEAAEYQKLAGQAPTNANLRGSGMRPSERGYLNLEESRSRAAAKMNDETNQKVTALGTSVHSEVATKASADDVKTVDTKVVGVRTDLDTTKEDLKMAKSEMGTLIARNHEEIDQLRRLGERDYIEFTITGRNKPQRVANVTLELKGVNEKRNQFDLAITVEDKLFVKKNRAANEPIFFFTTGTSIPEEIVINKIGGDTVSGYVSVSVGKMIERTASLSLIVKNLEVGRTALEEITRNHDGYFAELSTSGQSNVARTLMASMRVPAPQLDVTLAELRKLGQLDEEKQGGEEVSRQYVDLKARLENGRHTEKRLTELLAKRADRLKDVLDVERELASTREEIERMEAQQRNIQQQVNYATIELNLREEYKPALNLAPAAAGTRMRNALVDGYHAVVESALGLVLFLLQDGPSILFWLLLLFLPARWAWRKLRFALATKPSLAGAV